MPNLRHNLAVAVLILLAAALQAHEDTACLGATTAPSTGTITGTVTAGGKPVAGATLFLGTDTVQAAPSAGEAATTTSAAGVYTFTGVPFGSPVVRQQLPAGRAQVTPTNGYGQHVTLTAAQPVVSGQDFTDALVAAPAATVAPPIPAAWAIPPGKPLRYVANEGNDANDGTTPAKAWKTIKTLDNADVILAAGETFDTTYQINFDHGANAWLGGDPSKPLPTICATLPGQHLFKWDYNATNDGVANVKLTSADGSAQCGTVYGYGSYAINVDQSNLVEGFDWQATGYTITDGSGAVQGRCHYLIGTGNVHWSGGTFGPASTQSPVRFSAPGPTGGTVSNVTVTQVGTHYAIAGWAIHAAKGVTFNNCRVLADQYSEQFSLDSAGDEVGAGQVSGCTFNNLVVSGSQLAFGGGVATGCTFNSPTVTCLTSACIVVGKTGTGNVIDGGTLTTNCPNGDCAIAFPAAGDTVIKNCIVYTSNPKLTIFGGAWTKANDGGGNKLVLLPVLPTTGPSH